MSEGSRGRPVSARPAAAASRRLRAAGLIYVAAPALAAALGACAMNDDVPNEVTAKLPVPEEIPTVPVPPVRAALVSPLPAHPPPPWPTNVPFPEQPVPGGPITERLKPSERPVPQEPVPGAAGR